MTQVSLSSYDFEEISELLLNLLLLLRMMQMLACLPDGNSVGDSVQGKHVNPLSDVKATLVPAIWQPEVGGRGQESVLASAHAHCPVVSSCDEQFGEVRVDIHEAAVGWHTQSLSAWRYSDVTVYCLSQGWGQSYISEGYNWY